MVQSTSSDATSLHSLSKEGADRAASRSKTALSAGWSTVSLYGSSLGMRLRSHTLGLPIDSGSSGGTAEGAIRRFPAIELAAARNQASYSVLASTTRISRSERAFMARRSNSGARSLGQSFSASRTIRMRPSVEARRAANSTARSSSPALTTLSLLTRMGRRACTAAPSESAIRRSSIGTASTSQ